MTTTTEPTGREPYERVDIDATSVTERAVFRTCRRQWLLNTVKRLGTLEGNPNFILGTAVHSGLAAYYGGILRGDDRTTVETAGLKAYADDIGQAVEAARVNLGFVWETYRETYQEMVDLGTTMLTGYFANEVSDPLGKPLVVEERHRVPIGNKGHVLGYLSLQTDLIALLANGMKAIVDHKTATSSPNSGQLDFNDQLTGYAWGWWRLTGEIINVVGFNVLMKKAPHKPKVLKSGKLSVDRSQVTTHALFLEAIEEIGASRNEYAEHLMWLREEGPKLFVRDLTFRNVEQLRSFEENLLHEWVDMRGVARRPVTAYPSPSPFNCPSCPVKLACSAMMNGEDVESAIRSNYVILPPRH